MMMQVKFNYQKVQAQLKGLVYLHSNHIAYDVVFEELPAETLPSDTFAMLEHIKAVLLTPKQSLVMAKK